MFQKELFSNDGPYLRYRTDDAPYGKIVARFKYSGPFTKAKLKKFLVKSGLSPQEYFEMFNSGRAPLDIWRDLDPASYNATLEAWRAKQCA